MSRRLLVGTRNPSRIEMVRRILHASGIEVLTLAELGITDEIEEDQTSTQANAEKKARAYFALSRFPTLAMDGGLHIDRFPPERQPGVMVKRMVGNGQAANDHQVMAHYRLALIDVGGESPGTWTGSQALAISGRQVIASSFQFKVLFTAKLRGSPQPGLSLDPLMIDPASGRYYTEIPVEERPYYRHIRDFLMQHARLL